MKHVTTISLMLATAVGLTFTVTAADAKFGFKKSKPAAPAANAAPQAGNMVTTPSGLQYQDLVVGKGPMPRRGQHVTVNYTGWLTNGKKFDSSLDHGQPFTFTLGQGDVIRGWDEGVATMHIGGKRKLIVPASLGYGQRGMGPIPANSTLVFEVDLLSVH